MSAQGKYEPKCNNDNVMTCQNNVASLINNNGPYDFVGLQEASRWSDIQKSCRETLAKMTPLYHISGREEMVLFYDQNKYGLLKDMKGEFHEGRPFMIGFFGIINSSQTICVMNLHPGHGNEITQLENLLISNKDIVVKMTHIIIMGDMNNPYDGSKFAGFGL
jgi:endonuclease/exonuclease/phosphatase family metal-dependent hydrolase